MNILIIARGYPDKNDPQWGGFERDQAEALSSIGHNVVVASVDKRFRLYRRSFGRCVRYMISLRGNVLNQR